MTDEITLRLSFDEGAVESLESELSGVSELRKREQITDEEAERWADEAVNDTIENRLKTEII